MSCQGRDTLIIQGFCIAHILLEHSPLLRGLPASLKLCFSSVSHPLSCVCLIASLSSKRMQSYVIQQKLTPCHAGHAPVKPGLQALVDSCRGRQPRLVQQVESMMTELEHMSVLWAEQWHIALLELQVCIAVTCQHLLSIVP